MPDPLFVILLAVLVVIGILLHHPSRTLGIPSLLIFMGVGLTLGNGEFNFIYDNLPLTESLGAIALNIIVFVGGLNTRMSSIRVAWREGAMLSTVGVLLTTIIFAVILYQLFDFNFLFCLLFAAVVSSTDAAAVFGILETKKLALKQHTDSVLEFESATNDPVALVMVVMLTEMLTGDVALNAADIGLTLVLQIGVAAVFAVVLANIAVWLLNHIRLEEYGMIPVFVLAVFIITCYGSELLGGNILLTAYLSGVILGNGIQRGQLLTKHFFNGLSWLAQSLMFIVLGLQLFPEQLLEAFVPALIPALLLILIARPLAVHLCLLPFRQCSWQKRLFISSIGLKGATPIVFALIPLTAGIEGTDEMMNMVFFVVLLSVLLQGGILAPLAHKLKLVEDDNNK